VDDRRRTAITAAAVFVAALLPRLYVAIAWAREPVWDGHYYDFGARRIAEGMGYSDDVIVDGITKWHPWCHYPVGYSAFLAALYVVFGLGAKVATIGNAVVGSGLASLVYLLGARAFGHVRGVVAGVIVALMPELILYSALLMTEPLASVAPIAAAWLALRDREKHPLRGAALAGLVLGLGTLVRPQTVLGAPGLLLLAIDPSNLVATGRRALAVAGVATATCVAVVLPWTARNCSVMDGCAFVSTNAGWNLAIGALPKATGRFETLRAADGCPVVTGQVQQDRCWAKEGVSAIRNEPGRWLSLVPKKLGFTFDHASFPVGYLGEADKARWDEPSKATWRERLTFSHRCLLVLASLAAVTAFARAKGAASIAQAALGAALLGLAAYLFSRDETRPFWVVAALTPIACLLPLPGRAPLGPLLRYLVFTYVAVVITHAVFFGEDRYHVFLTPVLALMAAAAFRAFPEAVTPEALTPGPSPRAGEGS
jgi:hypothetical protein